MQQTLSIEPRGGCLRARREILVLHLVMTFASAGLAHQLGDAIAASSETFQRQRRGRRKTGCAFVGKASVWDTPSILLLGEGSTTSHNATLRRIGETEAQALNVKQDVE